MITSILSGFDKTEKSECGIIQPWKYSDFNKSSNKKIIARGSGLSYCNAGAIENGICIEMKNFNRILDFDEKNETITVETGIQIGDLNNFLIKRGWIMPVLPGYPTITTGGCIAFNVHGKSQYKIGTFMDWVDSITLYHPSHGEIKCSRMENVDIFNLTIGGMGFTGLIMEAKIKIKRNDCQNLEIFKIDCENINHAVQIFKENVEKYDFVYSWNDMNSKGKSFGRGIVYLEKLVSGKTYKDINYKNKLNYASDFPGVLNNLTIPLMCSTYFYSEKIKTKRSIIGLQRGSFPIYGKEVYYYLFGKNGFREYQVLFPFESWENAVKEIQSAITRINISVSLGSLKLFQGKSHNISFTGNGVCLAIDVKATQKSLQFFKELDRITLENKGTINLSKDSRADSDFVSKIFPAYNSFKQNLFSFDPEKIFYSDLRNRLNL